MLKRFLANDQHVVTCIDSPFFCSTWCSCHQVKTLIVMEPRGAGQGRDLNALRFQFGHTLPSAEDEDCGQLFKMMANCRAVGHHLGELASSKNKVSTLLQFTQKSFLEDMTAYISISQSISKYPPSENLAGLGL